MGTTGSEIIAQEMHSLREELRDLKAYQFRLVSIAAVVTGFLLSLTRLRLDSAVPIPPERSLYLLPLIVIVPSWWIFFDKTKTITRIVAYCRILEAMLSNEAEAKGFMGWERSLGEFRKKSNAIVGSLKQTQKRTKGIRLKVWRLFLTVSLIESQRYWTLAYGTFLTLSVVCLWVPVSSNYPFSFQKVLSMFHVTFWKPEWLWLIVAMGITSYCTFFNAIVLSRLIWGQHSYDFMEKIWKEVLSVHSEP